MAESYISPENYEPEADLEDAVYARAMNPKIEPLGRGSCNLCRMALEIKESVATFQHTVIP